MCSQSAECPTYLPGTASLIFSAPDVVKVLRHSISVGLGAGYGVYFQPLTGAEMHKLAGGGVQYYFSRLHEDADLFLTPELQHLVDGWWLVVSL